MSELWWLQPGWTKTPCARCGANIHATGGDPDWGFCWPCMQQRDRERELDERERALAERESGL